jgi:ribonuclease-3
MALPHEFQDEALLTLALTHSSTHAREDNERLEFLGDAVLDLVVVDELYADAEQYAEGTMTEMKSAIVSRRCLADAATRLNLSQDAIIGHGMRRETLPRSVLANLYEAVLGAIYLDAGLEAARAFALTTLREELDQAREMRGSNNPKQELQIYSQRTHGDPPEYALLSDRGSAHARAFLVAAEFGGQRHTPAWGRTLKEAEQWAAHEALLALKTNGALEP